jgi:hypothetical protein
MRERIEQALSVLVGLPLWSAGRTLDLEWFHFGTHRSVTDRRGEPKEVGSYALHVQCAWRIIGSSEIIVASRDRYYPAGDPTQDPPDFEWSKSGANRCDERMETFLSNRDHAPLLVESVQADLIGGFRLFMGEGYALEVFPDDSVGDELWRLFQPYTEADHFVVTGRGIEE